jgi:hypothetical protein
MAFTLSSSSLNGLYIVSSIASKEASLVRKSVGTFSALIVMSLVVSTFGQALSTEKTPSSSGLLQLFDPARGVVLKGAAGQEAAEMCGASPESKSWEVAASDIAALEQQLAPLLARDLVNTGSKNLPRQYYRQYASGRLNKYHAIFINGFHENSGSILG